MINYVNNSFDKVLKPCDAQQFMTLTRSEQTEKLILGHRAGEKNSKAKLPALTYMGVLDEAKYKDYLKRCEEQGTKPLGSRRAEFMRPTGLLMLDFDHVGRPIRDGVTLSNAKSLAESHAESQREIPLCARDDRDAVIDSPVKMWEQICKGASERELDLGQCLALAHITPSGDGLRLVVTRDKGKTIAECQYRWTHEVLPWLGVNVPCDDVCKDISRLSFAPMHKEVLYCNPSLLFGELPDASDYPDGTLWGGDSLRATLGTPSAPQSSARPSINRGTVSGATLHPEGEHQQTPPLFIANEAFRGLPQWQTVLREGSAVPCTTESWVPEGRGSSKQSAEQYPTDYNGIEYAEIVKRLEEQLGGRPEHGARNSFIFSMACNLRYICNDDPRWIAAILPTYGEDAQKHRMTVQSAINRPMSREMPDTIKRALGVAKMCGEGAPQHSTLNPQHSGVPALPSALPEPIRLLTSRTPDRMKAAVAMAIFPPLGAHLHGAQFHYIDNRDYEATFMHVLVAELSSGKSAVNMPIEYILADIEARDDVARKREREWKEQCSTISNTKDRPERPKGLAMQVLSADMTNAAFVQRLADAEGRFLYTQMDEIELLDSLKTNTRGGSVSAVLRLAFDCGKYGQERVASTAVNAKVRVRWNWNASTTVQRVRKYFAGSIADGTLSRLSFSTIMTDADDWGERRPRFGDYGDHFADELRPYIDSLCGCKGIVRCSEAEAWAEALCDELIIYARQIDDRTYAKMSFRAVLMGFFRAMLLYVMNGMRWNGDIANFATWSVKYDLWCKLHFFGDKLRQDLEGETTAQQVNPRNLLELLPREFSRQMAQEMRVAQGRKPNPTNMLSQWIFRGFITHDKQRGVYVKSV